MENPVGLRFRPTDEEIVHDYLGPKNLDINTSHVDRVISTVNIRSFDPWELPSQSRIKLKDQVWCFFSRKENKYDRGERQIRKTKSGFWKITGKPKDIMRTSGKREKIGERKVLMFYMSKKLGGSKSNWVIHEYHHFVSPNQIMPYTICKVMFKGNEKEMCCSSSSGCEIENTHSLIPHQNNSGGLNTETEGSSFDLLHSQELQNQRLFSGFLDEQEETQLEDAMRRAINNISNDDFKSLFDDAEESKIVSLQEDYNDYRPKKSSTCVFIGHSSDDDSDSDSISATTSSIETSSTFQSFGSSNHHIDQITDLQESPNSTIELVSLPQEVNKALGTKWVHNVEAQESEIDGFKMGQEMIKKKRAGFFYRIKQKLIKKIQLCFFISRT